MKLSYIIGVDFPKESWNRTWRFHLRGVFALIGPSNNLITLAEGNLAPTSFTFSTFSNLVRKGEMRNNYHNLHFKIVHLDCLKSLGKSVFEVIKYRYAGIILSKMAELLCHRFRYSDWQIINFIFRQQYFLFKFSRNLDVSSLTILLNIWNIFFKSRWLQFF